jgi:L-threonylcarbamoyladenylate synthase
LRPGSVTLEALRGTGLNIKDYVPASPDEPARSPGMKYKHYAPKTAVVKLINGNSSDIAEFINQNHENNGFFVLQSTADLIGNGGSVVSAGFSAETAAERLYGVLRDFDKAGVKTIYVECFDEEGVGAALMNRLTKAAEEIICL